MEKEISETYSFRPLDFDEKGRRIVDGLSFRDVVKEYERDFHYRHSTEYALNLYANSKAMALLAKSNDAAPFLMYGMDLTPLMLSETHISITKWTSIVKASMYMA